MRCYNNLVARFGNGNSSRAGRPFLSICDNDEEYSWADCPERRAEPIESVEVYLCHVDLCRAGFAANLLYLDRKAIGAVEAKAEGTLGEVFKMTLAGNVTILYSFTLFDGWQPVSNIIQGKDGNYYGTTFAGGANNAGTIFNWCVPLTKDILKSGSRVKMGPEFATNWHRGQSDAA